MKWAFTILLCIHGTIHLIGFVKAFYETTIDKQIVGTPKVIGVLWLIVSIMFMVSAISFFNSKKWFYLAFIGVVISQILIVNAWTDSKNGTIINIIILLVSMSALGTNQFNQLVDKEVITLFQNTKTDKALIVGKKNISHLPEIIQRWMKNSNAIGKPTITAVRLKQKGQMKTKPNGKWMHFTANQYFNIETPAFVWTTKVNTIFGDHIVGRDKLVNGEGEILIKLFGVIMIVNKAKNEKINQGAMLRFLAEMCWFPPAALNEYIEWEPINDTSAKVILTSGDKRVSGIYKFDIEGNILAFEAKRYFGGSKDSKLEKWVINIKDYKVFDGYKIPYKCKVTWKLKEGTFNWLDLEIIDLQYNKINAYESK